MDASLKTTRAEWLSTLRGMAALLVFASHLGINASEDLLFIFGRTGVTLFFLISGYLTYTARTGRTAKQYLFNRFVRMYPVYWIILILGWLAFEQSELSLVRLLANMTLFEQFLGQEIILAPSWMMPIMICFFLVAGVGGAAVLQAGRLPLMTGLFGAAAILSGALRAVTGMPFPTAFPLLMMTAFLGLSFYFFYSGKAGPKTLWACVAIFELALAIAAVLSYDNWWAYLIAYNTGLAAFAAGRRVNLNVAVFSRLGDIGFPFFLGSGIIGAVLRRTGIYEAQGYMTVMDCAIKFVLDLILAYVITRVIERPVLKRAKAIEKKL